MYRVWMAILILFHRHLNSLSPSKRKSGLYDFSLDLYALTLRLIDRAVTQQRFHGRVGRVELLSQHTMQSRKIAKNSLRRAEFQCVRNGSTVHQNGNVSQIEGDRFDIDAKQERNGPSFSFQ